MPPVCFGEVLQPVEHPATIHCADSEWSAAMCGWGGGGGRGLGRGVYFQQLGLGGWEDGRHRTECWLMPPVYLVMSFSQWDILLQYSVLTVNDQLLCVVGVGWGWDTFSAVGLGGWESGRNCVGFAWQCSQVVLTSVLNYAAAVLLCRFRLMAVSCSAISVVKTWQSYCANTPSCMGQTGPLIF